ncbi:concanavalin A-like lectin/glucanase domain-containing protein [Phyllosticta citricarpa]|uniref:chitinase n=2 Tax=Phyllosticta TaxID=121621 RepID=A0ABR1MBK8_9PEZI
MRQQQMFGAATALLTALVPLASAQLTTDCNPTENSTCPADSGLNKSTFYTDFTTGDNSSWTGAIGTTLEYSENGAAFVIENENQAPTLMTDFYIFFGYVEVEMRAANGTGVVSSIVLESDDLDEIDWEWLGGNNTSVETNYFGKGNTTSYDRAIYYGVDTPTDTFHKYGINWTPEAITWSIDGQDVRTLNYSDALNGKNFPQTPSRVSLGVWSAGTKKQNYWTVQWAGGYTDFDQGPFIMYVKNVKVINYNPGMNYNWTDTTGDYKSIKVLNTTVADNTTAVLASASASAAGTANTASSSSSGGGNFAQSSGGSGGGDDSAASASMDRAWILTGSISLVGFALGFAML